VAALKRGLFDKSLIALLVSQVESLRDNIAQVFTVEFTVAVCFKI